MTPPCCQANHPFDTFCISELWWPKEERFLIIGESPGGTDSHYFYDVREDKGVRNHFFCVGSLTTSNPPSNHSG